MRASQRAHVWAHVLVSIEREHATTCSECITVSSCMCAIILGGRMAEVQARVKQMECPTALHYLPQTLLDSDYRNHEGVIPIRSSPSQALASLTQPAIAGRRRGRATTRPREWVPKVFKNDGGETRVRKVLTHAVASGEKRWEGLSPTQVVIPARGSPSKAPENRRNPLVADVRWLRLIHPGVVR